MPKKPTIRELIVNLESNMNARFDNVEKRLDNLEVRVTKIEVRVEEMANTPTMKKELEQTKKPA